jgi:glycosyltransferase involved in cell wall biosynthesis
MKILCIIPFYYPAFKFGGPIASVHGLNKELVRNNVSVTVFTTNAGQNERVLPNLEYNIDGVKVVYFNSISSWFFSINMTKFLKNSISEFDCIYVNGLWNYPAAAACYYSRLFNRPYIIAPRGMLYRYTMGKKIWKKWPYYQLISKIDIRGASAIHYTSNDEATQCHSRLGLKNKALVIPNGIDLFSSKQRVSGNSLREKYPVLKGKKVILFLSRLSWKKGLDILVEAFDIVAREERNVHLLIVGPDENDYRKKISKWLSNKGIEDKVTFTGMLEGVEKNDAYVVGDIFTLPSYSENFGMVVAEAMASGMPVVISDQVGLCDDVKNSGSGIVIEVNAKQLSEALMHLLENPGLSSKMGSRGKALVFSKYNWNDISRDMINIMSGLIK